MELTVQKRNIFGKDVKTLRQKGLVPAELYGRGFENLHLAVAAKDLLKALKAAGESTVVNIVVDNKKHPTLIYGLQRDPVSDEILSVDFYQVHLDEKIKVRVPIEFRGVAPAVKDLGGIFVKAMSEIEVEALPGNLPHSLAVDLGSLKDIGQSLYVKDLQLPADVKLLVNPETVIASVVAPVTEEKEAAAAAPIDISQIKVETEEKKAAREAEKTEKAPETPAGEKK